MSDFFLHSLPEITILNIFLSFSYLIKWFLYENLGFILFLCYRHFIGILVCLGLVTTWCCSSSCCSILFMYEQFKQIK